MTCKYNCGRNLLWQFPSPGQCSSLHVLANLSNSSMFGWLCVIAFSSSCFRSCRRHNVQERWCLGIEPASNSYLHHHHQRFHIHLLILFSPGYHLFFICFHLFSSVNLFICFFVFLTWFYHLGKHWCFPCLVSLFPFPSRNHVLARFSSVFIC